MRPTLSTLTLGLTIVFASTILVAGGTSIPDGSRSSERIKRGAYLVAITGCHDCHSPKVDTQMTPDGNRLLSGRPITTLPPVQEAGVVRASMDFTAWSGPWGNSYAANLTPDGETGLGGRYTEAAFIKTMRTGKKPEGEDLLPPMPWPAFRHMTDEDLKAVYAYLTSLKPVKNFVRAAPALVAAKH
jgi:mono/diheme cytochrome c family protein